MRHEIQIQIIESACNGDAAAIEELLHQCQPSITSFAQKHCATTEDVEDAVQLTLWVVYQKINTLRTSKAFVSWVFKIVRNYCYRLLSRDSHFNAVDISALNYLSYTDDTELLWALKQDIIKAIEHIPPAYREVFIMRDMLGFTSPEVAEQLGLSLATIKSRLHRARIFLRERLEDWVT